MVREDVNKSIDEYLERSICQALSKITKHKDINHFEPKKVQDYMYNCWGFVSYLFGWTSKIDWVYHEEMEKHPKKHTVKVKEPSIGDIAVYRETRRNDLTHTAIVTDTENVSFLHKPGSETLEIIQSVDMERLHPSYKKLTEFRRVIQEPSLLKAEERLR